MKKWIALALALLLAVLGYAAAGPYLAVHAIGKAVREENAAALAKHVDFPPLRASLKAQLTDRMVRAAGIEAGHGDMPRGAVIEPRDQRKERRLACTRRRDQ